MTKYPTYEENVIFVKVVLLFRVFFLHQLKYSNSLEKYSFFVYIFLMYVFLCKKGTFYYETNKRVSPVECNFAHKNTI